MLTAKEARELTDAPRIADEIISEIECSAKLGKSGMDVKGYLHFDVVNILKGLGYKTTWVNERGTTWIWWG